MEKGEAARVALAVGILTDWLARTEEHLSSIEQRLTAMSERQESIAVNHNHLMLTNQKLEERVKGLEWLAHGD